MRVACSGIAVSVVRSLLMLGSSFHSGIAVGVVVAAAVGTVAAEAVVVVAVAVGIGTDPVT